MLAARRVLRFGHKVAAIRHSAKVECSGIWTTACAAARTSDRNDPGYITKTRSPGWMVPEPPPTLETTPVK
ncbi:uncharacterized protein PG998_000003 [Apiospora kogelbergensis]|uniref:uncharacterized protein n=1 Tax=Apiospora kogelbergensis TaxID=1337665 RepID=UPI0031302678